jgi:hypothetical protein
MKEGFEIREVREGINKVILPIMNPLKLTEYPQPRIPIYSDTVELEEIGFKDGENVTSIWAGYSVKTNILLIRL